ncbi:hypothetical protein MKEN_00866000 [Mycena kentingensis (nom. inval.)]|nr:hypothetical protein MKEN_00866000 [Mycena kentingensis (nom. inval.)]
MPGSQKHKALGKKLQAWNESATQQCDSDDASVSQKDAEIAGLRARMLELEDATRRTVGLEQEIAQLRDDYHNLKVAKDAIYRDKHNAETSKRKAEVVCEQETGKLAKRIKRMETEREKRREELEEMTTDELQGRLGVSNRLWQCKCPTSPSYLPHSPPHGHISSLATHESNPSSNP